MKIKIIITTYYYDKKILQSFTADWIFKLQICGKIIMVKMTNYIKLV